jgi:hypothetical protein
MSEEKIRFEDLLFATQTGGEMTKRRPAAIYSCSENGAPETFESSGYFGNVNDINETIRMGSDAVLLSHIGGRLWKRWQTVHPLLGPYRRIY